MKDGFTQYEVHNYDVLQPTRIVKNALDETDVITLEQAGFIPQKWLLTKDVVTDLRREVSLLLDNQRRFDGSSTYSTKKFAGIYVRDAHLQSSLILRLLSDDFPFVAAARQLMGPRIVVRSFSLRYTAALSGHGTMWHSDQRSFVTPRPVFFTEPHVFTITIYLDGADRTNGRLFVLPGSHRAPHQVDNRYDDIEGQIALDIEPGGVTLFHSALAHRGEENTGGADRRILVMHFCPIFCRTANYAVTNVAEDVAEFIQDRSRVKDEAFLELVGRPGLRYPLFM